MQMRDKTKSIMNPYYIVSMETKQHHSFDNLNRVTLWKSKKKTVADLIKNVQSPSNYPNISETTLLK